MKSEAPEEPVFFCKSINCLILNGEPIVYPKILYGNEKYKRVDHEVELAVVVKNKCKNISTTEAYSYVLGYTIFLDITARNLQKIDRELKSPWYRSKSFDTFGPIGPNVVNIDDPHDLAIKLEVNGVIKQSSNTKRMIFKVPEILAYISKFVTLEPGDIIATGTPDGVGPIWPGEVIKASIEKIGTLIHEVVLEDE